MSEIVEALQALEVDNDDHWTGQGLPRLSVLADLGLEVTRKDIQEVAPLFTRENPVIGQGAEVEVEENLVLEKDPEPEPEAAPEPSGSPAKPVEDEILAYVRETTRKKIGRAQMIEEYNKQLEKAGVDLRLDARSTIDQNMAARNRSARKNR